jgi:2-methylcitrate dehydratase PrpD
MTHLETIGAWIAGGTAAPEDVRRAARAQVIDMAAAVHATVRSGIGRSVLDGVAALGSSGRATSLADGARVGAVDAAMANAAMSMAHDFDDIVWMGHACHSAVFASLAVGEHVGASVRDVIDAVVVANEVAGRLGASSMLGPLNGQMWTFIHLAGAAAASARLLHLDAARTTHALAIALAQPEFALQPGFMRPTSKLLAAATPTAAGIRAAFYARAGMTGAPEILEDARGFWRRFSYLPLPEMMGDLGDFWVLRTLAVKTYPGCHYFQTALAALDRILARRADVRVDRVRRVLVGTTKLGCEVTRFASEYIEDGRPTPVSVNFDLAQSIAVMLAARTFGVEQLEEPWLDAHAADIRAWRALVEVRHDPALTARSIASMRRVKMGRAAIRRVRLRELPKLARRYADEYRSRLASPREIAALARALVRRNRAPRGARTSDGLAIALEFPNEVTIVFTDGSRETERIDVPSGALASPGFTAALEEKAMNELSYRLGPAAARAAIDFTWTASDDPASTLAGRLAGV